MFKVGDYYTHPSGQVIIIIQVLDARDFNITCRVVKRGEDSHNWQEIDHLGNFGDDSNYAARLSKCNYYNSPLWKALNSPERSEDEVG